MVAKYEKLLNTFFYQVVTTLRTRAMSCSQVTFSITHKVNDWVTFVGNSSFNLWYSDMIGQVWPFWDPVSPSEGSFGTLFLVSLFSQRLHHSLIGPSGNPNLHYITCKIPYYYRFHCFLGRSCGSQVCPFNFPNSHLTFLPSFVFLDLWGFRFSILLLCSLPKPSI